MPSEVEVTKVLFVCTGNTCRSPMAEAIFAHLVSSKNVAHMQFHIESAGTSDKHVGCDITPKVKIILDRTGIRDFNHTSRQIKADDLNKFDYIVGMDDSHMCALSTMAENVCHSVKPRILLLGQFNPNRDELIVEDPFGKCVETYEKCYEQIFVSCEHFFCELISKE